MERLSVVIITYNEERNIERCLDSVIDVADEIIVVDSFSTDNTEEICSNYNLRFIKQEFLGYIEQKNYALTFVNYKFVLALDADEALSEELKRSILQAKINFLSAGYSMNRLTNYCGKWIKHCGWYPDTKLRLFNRELGWWGGTNPHDEVIIEKEHPISHLKGDLLHYSYYTLDDHNSQVERFTDIAAGEYFKKGIRVSKIKMYISPIVKFIRDYFFLLGFLDGGAGLRICYISAGATYKKYQKLRGTVNSIIISRTDSLGDVILTLPLAGAIKKQNPNIKVIFLGRTYSKSIIETSDYVDEFINFDDILKKTNPDQISYLKGLNADAIIHVFPNKEIAQISKKAGIPIRVGTNHRLFHLTTCNRLLNLGRKSSKLHEVQLNLKLLSPFNIKYNYSLTEIPELYGYNDFGDLNENLRNLLSKKRNNLIIHPKSKGSAREWGLDNFSKLVDLLPDKKYKIFVTGTQEEGNLMFDFLKKHEGKIVNLTGTLSLNELIAFISKADALVATSTGPLHIAAATGIKAVGIFAPMRPIHPGRWKPVGKNADYLVVDKKCSKCRNGGICDCIVGISENQVYNKLLV